MHKKYIKKGGKVFGPYYYETKRVNGEVVTTYVGKPINYKSYLTPVFIGLSLVLIAISFFIYFKGGYLTGNLILEINKSESFGEELDGNLKVVLRAGELLPADTKIEVNLGNQTKNFLLFDLISHEKTTGFYYISGKSLSGEGDGYGRKGKKESYPVISFNFSIKILSEETIIGDGNETNVTESGNINETISENETETSGDIPTDKETESKGLNETESDNEISNTPAREEQTGSGSVTPTIDSSPIEESDSTQTQTSPDETGALEEGSVASTSQSSQNSNSDLMPENVLTGSAILEESQIISGSTSRNKPYSYNLAEGETAGLISGSVVYNGTQLDDYAVEFNQEGTELKVTTNYSAIDEGFGEDYLNDENFTLDIPLKSLNLRAEDGELEIILSYGDEQIGKISQNVVLIGNESITENITIIENETKDLIHDPIKVGEKVRWVKRIIKNESETRLVELPELSENISVFKNIESNSKKEKIIDTKIYKKAKHQEVLIEENESLFEIEYYTPAPVSYEEELPRGKKIIISGPDELNYSNVLSFTSIPEIKDKDRIKIFWVEQNTLIDFEANDSNGNELFDSISWIVPHLSNQTFNIIFINKAVHLDDNRTLVEDIYDYVKTRDYNYTAIPEGHYIRITFEQNLTRNRDITIYAKSNSSSTIEVYEIDSDQKISVFDSIIDDKEYKVYLTNLTGEQDSFDLRVARGDVEFDYIVDPILSPENNAFVSGNSVILNWTNNKTRANIWVYGSKNLTTLNGSLFYFNKSAEIGNYIYNWTNPTIWDNQPNLVGLFRFNNDSLLSESETVFADSSKWDSKTDSAYCGTTCATYVNGKFGNALNITSKSVYLMMNNHEIDNERTYTVSFWFNYLGAGSATCYSGTNGIYVYPLIVKGVGEGETATQDVYFLIGINQTGSKLCNDYEDSAGSTNHPVCGTTSISTGQWYFGTIVVNGTNNIIYLNGQQDGIISSSTYPRNLTTTPRIGIGQCYLSTNASTGNAAGNIKAIIDEVAFFNHSLEQNEVMELYNLTYGQYYWFVNQTNASETEYSGVYSFMFNVNSSDSYPTTTLTYPSTGLGVRTPIQLNCSATDNSNLVNISLFGNWSNQWHMNRTIDLSGTTNQTNFTINLGDGTYLWNCYACDNASQCSFATSNYSFRVDALVPAINFTEPTPANATSVPGEVFVNISIIENNLAKLVFNRDSTNYTIFNDSLKLMLDFNNNSALGENTTYAVDASLNLAHATCTSCPNLTEGKYENAYSFDGTNDVYFIEDAKLDGLKYYTIEFWVKPQGNGVALSSGTGGCETHYPIISKGYGLGETNALDASFFIGLDSSTRTICFDLENLTGSDNYPASSSTPLTNGEWYHIIALHNETGTHVFVNGVLEGSNNFGGWPSGNTNHNVGIGRSCSGTDCTNGAFNGTIDAIRIWNYSFDGDEIRTLYRANVFKKNVNSWDFWINDTGLSSGEYTFFAYAEDSVGGANMTEVRTITVSDVNNPIVTFDYPLNASYSYNVSSINYTAIELNPESCWYSNSSGVWNSSRVNAGTNFTNVLSVLGNNKWDVWCNDSVGNTGNTSVVFNIDYMPSSFLNMPPNGTTQILQETTFNCSATDAVGLINISLYLSSSSGGTESIIKTAYFRDDGTSVNETDDATINADLPDTNTDNTLLEIDGVGAHTHAVLRFNDLIGNSAGQIPPGSTILNANLTLHITSDPGIASPNVYILRENFTENEVTWNNRATGVAWSNAGADAAPSIDASISSTVPSVGTVGYKVANVSAFVQNWSNGAANYGIVIIDTDSNGMSFDSSDHGTATYRPLLSVTFQVAGTNWHLNETKSITGTSNSTTFTKTLADNSTYLWNCLVGDTAGNYNWSSYNFTLVINSSFSDSYPSVTLDYPSNGLTYASVNQLNCTANDNSNLVNISLFGNWSNQWHLNKTIFINGTTNQTNFTISLGDGTYSWNCYACDNVSQCSFGTSNWSFSINTLVPAINFTPPTPANASSVSGEIFVNVSLTEKNLAKFVYNRDGTNYSIYNSSMKLMMDFNNNSALGENTTYAVDASLNLAHATCTNCPTLSEGRFENAYSFDGTDDVYVIEDAKLDGLKYYTIEFWVKPLGEASALSSGTGGCTTHYPIISKGYGLGETSALDVSFFIGLHSTERTICFDLENLTGNDNYPAFSTTPLTNGNWFHVAAMHNESGTYLYLNGVLEGTNNFGGWPSGNTNHNIGIGRSCSGTDCTNGAFNGTIDAIRIWNYSFNDNEIKKMYKSNIFKHSNSNWTFLINETGNAVGEYSFFAYAENIVGNANQTEVRNIIISDESSPIVSFAYPGNITYNYNVSELNYSVSDISAQSCWYSNSSGIWNSTIFDAGVNFTNVLSVPGNNKWDVWCNDSGGNVGNASVVFNIDYMPSSFLNNPPNGTTQTTQETTFNCSASDTVGLENISLYLYSNGGGEGVVIYNEWITNRSTWKYNANNVWPGNGWFNSSFNDGSWSSGPGYLATAGETTSPGVNTSIPGDGAAYGGYYFRKTINITDASKVINMSFRIDYDDAYALYLNGYLISSTDESCNWNDHEAYCPPLHNSLIDTSGASTPYFPLVNLNSTHISYLVSGTNYLGVMIKQSAAGSSDAAFDMMMFGWETTGGVSWHKNETKNITGTSNSTTFTKTLADNSTYLWNCLAGDTAGNYNWSSYNYTLIINSSYGFRVIGLPTGTNVFDESTQTINYSSESQLGIKRGIILIGEDKIASFDINFTSSVNLTDLVLNTTSYVHPQNNLEYGKSFIHIPAGHTEISNISLFIPVIQNSGVTYVCPNASSFDGINESCNGIYYLSGLNNNTGYYVTNINTTGAAEIPSSRLVIWDINDSEGGGQTISAGNVAYFYANYTNSSDRLAITNANCSFSENSSGSFSGLVNMSYNSTSLLYEYNKIINTAGVFAWNASCNATGFDILEANDTISVGPGDTLYPIFSNYLDNNDSLTGSGVAWFNVTIENTNGTVFLEINGTNFTATNLTLNVYNVSLSMTNGTYSYYWGAWGNGTNTNYNISETRYYTINADITFPTIVFALPTPINNTFVNSSTVIVNVTGVEVNRNEVWLQLDEQNYSMTCSGSESYVCDTTFADIGQGRHTLIVSISDTAGNFNVTEMREFFVDSIYPAINFTNPTPGNNTNQTDRSIFVNLSTNDNSDHYSFVDFDRSLVGWWRMDDTNQSGGMLRSKVYDLSSSSNNGTASTNYGGTTNQTPIGKFGKAYNFDPDTTNSNGMYFIGTGGLIAKNPTAFASSVWIYSLGSGPQQIYQQGGSGYDFGLGITSDNIIFFIKNLSINSISTTTKPISALKWHHIVVNYNSSKIQIWVNGVESINSSVSGTINNTKNDFYIGSSQGWRYSDFQGSIDEVMIFNRSLSAAEIKSLYNASAYKYENNFTDLSIGNHTFKGYTVEAAGNKNQTEERTVQIYTTDNLYPIFSNYLDNNDSLTGSGVAWFNVTIENTNGTVFLEINGTNFTATNLTSNVYNVSVSLSNGTYSYYWGAWGNGTNTNYNISETRYYTINADITFPTIVFALPTPINGTFVNTSALTVNVTGVEVNRNEVWLQLDEQNYSMTCSGSSSYTCNVTFNDVGQGRHTLIVSISDTAGNFNVTEMREFFVDSIYPAINFTNPTPGNNTNQTDRSIFVNLSTNDNSDYYSFVDFDNSLIGWWRMDDSNQSGGMLRSKVYDKTGRNNGTAIANAINNNSGKFGKAITLNGKTDYIQVNQNTLINSVGITSFSVSFWVYPNYTYQSLITKRSGFDAIYNGWGIYINPSSNGIWLRTSNSSTLVQYNSPSILKVNNWNMISIVYNISSVNNSAFIYINGTLKFVVPLPIGNINSTNDLLIGGGNHGGASISLNGSLDEVLIFNRSLSAAEIKSLYNASAYKYENNFTDLSIGNHTFKGYTVDAAGNLNDTEMREVSVELGETAYSILLSDNLSVGLPWSIDVLPLLNASADGNNGEGATSYFINVSVEGGATIDLYMKANGDLANVGGDILGLGNETYSANISDITVPASVKQRLTTNYNDNKIGDGIGNNGVVYLKFFLNAPSRQAAGSYNNSIQFKAVPHGVAP